MPVLLALTAAACAREQQSAYYVIDPATGQPMPVLQQYAQPQYGQPQYAQAQYGQYAQTSYGPPAYAQPAYQSQNASTKRGLFTGRSRQNYAPQPYAGGAYAASRYGYAYAPAQAMPAYTLDSGDKLRTVVFGQEGITGSYLVDAGGNVSMTLIGTVPARGYATAQLSAMIAQRLKQGYVREPHVNVAVESYRPFFILGEVTNPGQYSFVAHMTAENAVAIAGGFGPRAKKDKVELTRNDGGQQVRTSVPLNYPLLPGDTIRIDERWF